MTEKKIDGWLVLTGFIPPTTSHLSGWSPCPGASICATVERERRLANGDRQRWGGGVKEKCATQSQNLLTWWKRVVEKTVSCSQKRDIKLQIELLEKLVYFHFIDENFRFVFLFFFFFKCEASFPWVAPEHFRGSVKRRKPNEGVVNSSVDCMIWKKVESRIDVRWVKGKVIISISVSFHAPCWGSHLTLGTTALATWKKEYFSNDVKLSRLVVKSFCTVSY